MGRSVEDWLASDEQDEWSQMMRKVAAFHKKHDFAGNNGHDMGYRIALTVEDGDTTVVIETSDDGTDVSVEIETEGE